MHSADALVKAKHDGAFLREGPAKKTVGWGVRTRGDIRGTKTSMTLLTIMVLLKMLLQLLLMSLSMSLSVSLSVSLPCPTTCIHERQPSDEMDRPFHYTQRRAGGDSSEPGLPHP